jgi:hypothetical protein
VIKSRIMRWEKNCISRGEKRNAYTNVVNPKGRCYICRLGPRWEGNIQMDAKGRECEDLDWTGSG